MSKDVVVFAKKQFIGNSDIGIDFCIEKYTVGDKKLMDVYANLFSTAGQYMPISTYAPSSEEFAEYCNTLIQLIEALTELHNEAVEHYEENEGA